MDPGARFGESIPWSRDNDADAVPATGLVTCMVLALSLSIETFFAGIGLLVIGLLGRLLTRA